jgi:inhibitor of KinA sporulation pathway (predicted exonuclease)
MVDFGRYHYYLVLDLEATCCNQETLQRSETETIEIGAVMVEAQSLEVIDEFQTFVRPVRYPILTEFCTSLTTITQAQVDQAVGYVEAVAQLQQWLSDYPNGLFGSWGNFDRLQFKQDSRFHQVPYPIPYPHTNLKKRFLKAQKLEKRCSMTEALTLAKISWEGTQHRGIDDARNIAKLLPYILGQKHLVEQLIFD